MRCRLFTSDRRFVKDVEILPFNTPPDLLVWGERFFILDKDTNGFVQPEYLEAFSFFVVEMSEIAS
jgi:hypothetical protein